MKSADQTASIPALALTAYAKAEDPVGTLAGGCQGHLLRPGGSSRIRTCGRGDVWLRA